MDEGRFGKIIIEALCPMRVACYRRYSQSPEEECAAFMKNWLAGLKLHKPVRQFGFDVDVPPEQAGPDIRGYELWANVPVDVEPAQEVEMRHFEGGLYATLKVINPFEDPFQWIPAGWQHLHQWVSTNDHYQIGEHQWLEEVVTDESVENIILYHPVMAKLG